MPGPVDAKPTIADYKAAMKALDVAREVATRQYAAAQATGDPAAGAETLATLKGAVEAFKDIRGRLTPTDLVIAEFNIEVKSPHHVSLVVPAGVSRFDLLCRASDAVTASGDTMIVAQYLMSQWKDDGAFMTPCHESTRVDVACFVGDIVGKSFEEQRTFLKDHGYEMGSVVDVAIGHVSHLLVKGRSMFGGFWNLRCADGLLQLDGHGRCITNHDTFYPQQVSPAVGSIIRSGKDSPL
jgi:hypothetical protein